MKQLILLIALCAAAQTVTIEPVIFSGSGLNDATAGGRYTPAAANAQYVATISATGTPDHFKWSKNGGSLSSAIAITGSAQAITDGVTIRFAATTGHTLNDSWTIEATASGSAAASRFVQRGVGALVGRDVEEKLRDFVSVRDFGAICDGKDSDDGLAIQRALDYQHHVFVPGGCGTSIELHTAIDGQHIWGLGSGSVNQPGVSYIRAIGPISGAVLAVLHLGVRIDGVMIDGAGLATYGVVAACAGNGGVISHNQIRNALTDNLLITNSLSPYSTCEGSSPTNNGLTVSDNVIQQTAVGGWPYTIGTVTATNGSTAVTGSGTAWTDRMNGGEILIGGVHTSIATVNSATSITLVASYSGTAGSGLSYALKYGGHGIYFTGAAGDVNNNNITFTGNTVLNNFKDGIDGKGSQNQIINGIYADNGVNAGSIQYYGIRLSEAGDFGATTLWTITLPDIETNNRQLPAATSRGPQAFFGPISQQNQITTPGPVSQMCNNPGCYIFFIGSDIWHSVYAGGMTRVVGTNVSQWNDALFDRTYSLVHPIWSIQGPLGGIIQDGAINAPGTAYTVGDIVTVVQSGATAGQFIVTAISGGGATGPVSAASIFEGHPGIGDGYSTATNLATTGGTGTGLTIDISVPYSGNHLPISYPLANGDGGKLTVDAHGQIGQVTNTQETVCPVATSSLGYAIPRGCAHQDVDSSAGGVALSLDGAPFLGETHDIFSAAFANTVSLNGQAFNINMPGGATTLVASLFSAANQTLRLRFNGTSWDVLSFGPRGLIAGPGIGIAFTGATTTITNSLSSTAITALTGDVTATGPGSAAASTTGASVTDTFLTGCSATGIGTSTATACTNAGCTTTASFVTAVTGVTLSCPTGSATFTRGLHQ